MAAGSGGFPERRPSRPSYVGNPYYENWISGDRWEQLIKIAAIIQAAVQYRLSGVPNAWLQDSDAPDYRGACYNIIAHIFPAPVPIGRINELCSKACLHAIPRSRCLAKASRYPKL
jgi:hypothetical protein